VWGDKGIKSGGKKKTWYKKNRYGKKVERNLKGDTRKNTKKHRSENKQGQTKKVNQKQEGGASYKRPRFGVSQRPQSRGNFHQGEVRKKGKRGGGGGDGNIKSKKVGIKKREILLKCK